MALASGVAAVDTLVRTVCRPGDHGHAPQSLTHKSVTKRLGTSKQKPIHTQAHVLKDALVIQKPRRPRGLLHEYSSPAA